MKFKITLLFLVVFGSSNAQKIFHTAYSQPYKQEIRNGKRGIVHIKNDEVLIPFEYDSFTEAPKGYLRAEKDKKIGLFDFKGNVVLPLEYSYVNPPVIKIGKRVGYFSLEKQKVIIEPQYDNIRGTFDEYIWALKDGKWGCVNEKNEMIVPFEYDQAFPTEVGTVVWRDSKKGFLSPEGSVIFPVEFNYVEVYGRENHKKFVLLYNGDVTGLALPTGEMVLPMEYDHIFPVSNDTFNITVDDFMGVINVTTGDTIIKDVHFNLPFEPYDGMYLITGKNIFGTGFADENFNVVVPPIYTEYKAKTKQGKITDLFPGGFLWVYLDGLWGLIDSTGKEIFKPKYEEVSYFLRGRAIVYKEGKALIINSKGEEVFEQKADGIEQMKYLITNGLTPLFGYEYYKILQGDQFQIYRTSDKEIPSILLDTADSPRRTFYYSETIVSKKNGKYGMISASGNIVLPFIFDEFDDYYRQVIRKRNKNNIEFFDRAGYSIYPKMTGKNYWNRDAFTEEGFGKIDCNFLTGQQWRGELETNNIPGGYIIDETLKRNRKKVHHYYDKEGNRILEGDFTAVEINCTVWELNALPAFKEGKWGLIDTLGNWILEPNYDKIQKFDYGLFPVENEGKYGFLNTKGEVVIPIIYKNAKPFLPLNIDLHPSICNECGCSLPYVEDKELYGQVLKDGKWQTIDIQGKIFGQSREYFLRECVPLELIEFKGENGKWGLKNDREKILIEPQFDLITGTNQGFISVKSDGKQGLYSLETGKVKFYDRVYTSGSEHPIWRAVKKNGLFGTVDNLGNEIIPPSLEGISFNHGNLTAFVHNGKVGFLNEAGEIGIPAQFDWDQTNSIDFVFQDGFVAVLKNGKYGYINEKGEPVTKFEFDLAWEVRNGYALVRKKGKWKELKTKRWKR